MTSCTKASPPCAHHQSGRAERARARRGACRRPLHRRGGFGCFLHLAEACAAACPVAGGARRLLRAAVKPQFEAGREAIGKGGILKDASAGERIAADMTEWLATQPAGHPSASPPRPFPRRRKPRISAWRSQGVSAMTLDITRLGAEGDGIAETANGPVYVPFAHPATAQGGCRKIAGTIMAITEPSPDRIAPVCRHFGPDGENGACGGCFAAACEPGALCRVQARPRRQRAALEGH